MIVGIDSNVLIYAGLAPSKGDSSKLTGELGIRAKMLLHRLHREKATILLPTIAVAELLVPIPKAKHGDVLAVLEKHFVCSPFSLHAAAIAAELWARKKSNPTVGHKGSRIVVKADAQILGTLIAGGATEFYTHDQNCPKLILASDPIEVYDLPANDPEDIFLRGDIERGDAES